VSKSTELAGAEPQIFVSDLAASFEYYAKMLGFTVAFSYGEPPFYGQIVRDPDGNLILFAGVAAWRH
jgi:hypothetical protein